MAFTTRNWNANGSSTRGRSGRSPPMSESNRSGLNVVNVSCSPSSRSLRVDRNRRRQLSHFLFTSRTEIRPASWAVIFYFFFFSLLFFSFRNTQRSSKITRPFALDHVVWSRGREGPNIHYFFFFVFLFLYIPPYRFLYWVTWGRYRFGGQTRSSCQHHFHGCIPNLVLFSSLHVSMC